MTPFHSADNSLFLRFICTSAIYFLEMAGFQHWNKRTQSKPVKAATLNTNPSTDHGTTHKPGKSMLDICLDTSKTLSTWDRYVNLEPLRSKGKKKKLQRRKRRRAEERSRRETENPLGFRGFFCRDQNGVRWKEREKAKERKTIVSCHKTLHRKN